MLVKENQQIEKDMEMEPIHMKINIIKYIKIQSYMRDTIYSEMKIKQLILTFVRIGQRTSIEVIQQLLKN